MKVFIIVQVLFVLIDCIIVAILTGFNVSERTSKIIGTITAMLVLFVNGLLVGYYDLSGVFYTISTVATGIVSIFFGHITSVIVSNLKGD